MSQNGDRPGQVSTYLSYLPAIYQEDVDQRQPAALGRFLLAFEHVLTGLGDVALPGLEEVLEGIPSSDGSQPQLAGLHRYFDPGPDNPDNLRAPNDFLDWLAGWVALTLRADWEPDEKRRLLAEIVPLYRKRGTREGLTRMLYTYTGLPRTETDPAISVSEFTEPLEINRTSTVGVDTMLGGGPPHYFLVKIILPIADPANRVEKEQIARAIIDQEKPAHTYYDLIVEAPTFQLGVPSRSTLGVNTVLP